MKYVAYYRVSTKRQGQSGLGLEAQKTAVRNFISSRGESETPPPFIETESGNNADRPELKKAIDRCKNTGSTLLIAKLDRLSRNVSFIFALRDELQRAGIDFVAADLPEANTLTLGIMATMAQHEREIISQRTRDGLAEAKKKGKKLGNPQNLKPEHRDKAHQAISAMAKQALSVRHAFHFIKPLRVAGLSFAKIAEQLNDEGYRTRRGKDFFPAQVQRIYERLNDPNNNA